MVLKAEFSLNTLLTAMRNVGCGDPHPVFAGGLRYVPPAGKGKADREAFEELSEYGFTQGDGFTPEFEDVLHLIDRPARQLHGYARDMTEQFGILVAVNGRSAVSVLCRGQKIELTGLTIDPVDALVAALPVYPSADLKAFSLPQEDFRKPPESDIFDDAPARSREAQELDAILQQPYYGIGQLYSDDRDQTLSYLDLDAGRVGITLADGYISVLPGDQIARTMK
ncbi:ESX secretion-associated protein EspG [Amycolatopsis sp. OK19-0408]|uniref:ESX secretion-associated protein EspG n=1 Tax=Amycolatopsis iheyensis TaxID=2945988 RepID=A0A9X2NEE8_9PSEU|nr:ESX secretion-associated protein EspG [Amycolatopsis iheyensis]MCR6485360.1 ESX secretion-associated protein EspG [Amycolatopsis iheyensis]